MYHQPVMLKESLEGLAIKPDGIYVDATFGGGGHSRAILKKLENGRLIAFDQDPDAAKNVIDDERFLLINQNFRYLAKMMRAHTGITKVDGILADLGISSHQIDIPERGFAHRLDGPLDMRMDKQSEMTAEDVLNSYEKERLQKIFGEYGEVRNARSLAEAIVDARNDNEIETVESFIEVINPFIRGNRNRYLSQVFQALRIEVNDEINALRDFLTQSLEVLKNAGRIVIISYHSLEDRIVKNFMRYGNTSEKPDKDEYGKETKHFLLITKKPVEPQEAEVKKNPRARSARLRVAERIN